MTWQPIETAPKDGTHILLFTEGFVIEGYFGRWSQWDEWTPVEVADANGCTNCALPVRTKPTHWMPLPEPPLPKDTATP